MAKVEVDEADFNLAVAQDKLLAELLGNSETGATVKRAIKKVRPDLNFPELDALDLLDTKTKEVSESANAGVKALEERIEKLQKSLEDKDSINKLQKDVDDTVRKFGFTEDGKQKLIKRAKEKGHLDWDAHAAAIIEAAPKAQPARQTTYFGEAMNPNGAKDYYNNVKLDDSLTMLNRNQEQWSEATAMDMINNPEKYPEMV